MPANIGTNIYIDVNSTVKLLKRIVKFEVAEGLVDDSVIVLHLRKFVPGAVENQTQNQSYGEMYDTKRRKISNPPTPQRQDSQTPTQLGEITGYDPNSKDGINPSTTGSVTYEMTPSISNNSSTT